MLTDKGLVGFAITPWARKDAFGSGTSAAAAGGLDLREMIAMFQGKATGAGLSRFSTGLTGGYTGVSDIGKIVANNVRNNIVPTAMGLVGLQVAKKFLKSKWGLTRPANKLLKFAGIKEVRF